MYEKNNRSLSFYLKILLFFSSVYFLSTAFLHASDSDILVSKAIQKINMGKADEAVPLLEKALKLAPEDLEAVYYAGLAYSKTGEYNRAESMFLKLLSLDEDAVYVYMELGRIYYIRSQCSKAEKHLAIFISVSEDKVSNEYASRMIEACTEDGTAEEEKRYRLNISVGGQYDTNVLLEPSAPTTALEKKKDGRSVLYLSAGATLFENEKAKLDVDYSVYQSLHLSLDDFNIHSHSIKPKVEFALSDTLRSVFGYEFGYTLFGGELYSRIHTLSAGININNGRNNLTEAVYAYNDNKYWDSDLSPTSSIRSGSQHTLTLKQHFFSGNVSANIHGLLDYGRTSVSYWNYRGFTLGSEMNFSLQSGILPEPMYLYAGLDYTENRYGGKYPETELDRLDRIQEYSIALTYKIRKNTTVTLSEGFTVNDSNIDLFDYDRSVTGVFITISLL